PTGLDRMLTISASNPWIGLTTNVLDLSRLGAVDLENGELKGTQLQFENFNEYILPSENNTFLGDVINSTVFTGNGNNTILGAALGSKIYLGTGSNTIYVSPGVDIVGLTDNDKIVDNGWTLFGGIRWKGSASPYAMSPLGFVEFGLNALGDLVIHLNM